MLTLFFNSLESPGFGGIRLAWVCLVSGVGLLIASAASSDVVEPQVNVEVSGRLHPAAGDGAKSQLRDHLVLLNKAQLPDTVSLTSLFGVALDDHGLVSKRIDELDASRSALSRRVSELEQLLASLAAEATAIHEENASRPNESAGGAIDDETGSIPSPAKPSAATVESDSDREHDAEAAAKQAERNALAAHLAQAAVEHAARGARLLLIGEERATARANLASVSLDIEIVEQRLTGLRKLARRLEPMSDAARRIMPTLGAERKSLRHHASLVSELAVAANGLASRLQTLATRSRTGLLVGFVSERRDVAADCEALATYIEQQSRDFEAMAASLFAIAEQVEASGAELRATVLYALLVNDRQSVLDELFLSHLRSQRRLRKSVSQVLSVPGAQSLVDLRAAIASALNEVDRIGTVADARAAIDADANLRQTGASLLSAELASSDGWRLAFENEVVTVLSEQVTPEVLTGAYGLSTEIIDDVVSELAIATQRLREQVELFRDEIPTATSLVSTPQGQSYLWRAGVALALFGACFFVFRKTSRITVWLVKNLVRLPGIRDRIGLLVRSSGLVQSVVPPLFALLALSIAIAVAGSATTSAEHFRVLLFPVLLYWLGRQILVGATRRLKRGRPALLEVLPETLDRLTRTYSSLGLVVAIGSMLDGIARIAVGAGRLVSLLDAAVLTWIVIWIAWEAVRWRQPLAKAWAGRVPEEDPESFEDRVAQWMEDSRVGFVLSPVALLRIFVIALVKPALGQVTRTGLMQRIRAQMLRHRSKQGANDVAPQVDTLPADYLDAFPLHPILGEDDALLVPREKLIDEVLEQIEQWGTSKAGGSLGLIGEKGVGKTTLAAMIGMRSEKLETVHHTIHGKPGTPEALVDSLASSFGFEDLKSLDELRVALCEGPERLVLLDEAHNVFLRRVDGFRAYDALVELVNATTSKVFWVVIFNSFTWKFLNETRGRVHYFRKLLFISKWSPEEIQMLIGLRNKRTGYELEFDEMLLSDDAVESKDFELIEGSDGYFRLLWESSGGNPRIASQLWLSSLSAIGEKKLRVGLFREPGSEALATYQDDLLFALAAYCQHENLSAQELSVVINLPEAFAKFAVQFLIEEGMIEAKDDQDTRHTLSPKYYRAVQRVLRSRHLLFE